MTKTLPQFVFIHIPKTGGGTFHKLIKNIYQEHYIQGIPKNKQIAQFNVILGHFSYDKAIKCGLGARSFITWVRDPIERVISHYFWAFYTENTKYVNIGPSQIKKFKNKIGITEFARIIPNQMTTYMGNDISKYTFIGVQEFYTDSLKRFQDVFNLSLPTSYPNYNIGINKQKVSDSDKEIIRSYNKQDYILYNLILEHLNYRGVK